MRFDCEATRENLEAWSLGALDDLEQRAFEHHIAGCTACSRLADEMRETAALLGLAVPMRAAGSSLKSRVMASARVLTPLPAGARVGVSQWWRTASGVAACVALAAISWGTVMQLRAGDLESDRSQLRTSATEQAGQFGILRADYDQTVSDQDLLAQTVATQNEVLDVVFEPDVQWTTLQGTDMAPAASARCAWSRQKALGAMIAQNLPPPGEDETYTMWLIYEDDWISAGTVQVDEQGRGRLVMRKLWGNQNHGRLLGFAVTLEESHDAEEPSLQLALASPID